MAKMTEIQSGTTSSFKVTIPKEMAKEFIEKHGKDISIKKCGKGFKILPVSEVKNEKLL